MLADGDRRLMYPLRFHPIFKRYLWGGRRLGTTLGKPIGPENDYAECWMVVDRGPDQSVVHYGEFRGQTLGALMQSDARALVGAELAARIDGQDVPESLRGRFPLLLKFLDAQQNLSVQVHPDDELAKRLTPPDLGKTEAWYIWDAEPESQVYGGFRAGVDPQVFRNSVRDGTTDRLLHSSAVRTGDCVLVPAGTIHAIGRGLLVAEIQQASDTTFRLFDWNRLDAGGRPRPLQIDPGIEALDFSERRLTPLPRRPHHDPRAECVVACDKFAINLWRLDGPMEFGGDNRFRILLAIDSGFEIEGDPAARPLRSADCALLPATLAPTEVRPAITGRLLEIFVPSP